MCSVTKQRSKQRRGVGWLVLVDDDLSRNQRGDGGVATGRRQTVETAMRHDGMVSEPCRQRPLNGDGVLTVTESAPAWSGPRVVVL